MRSTSIGQLKNIPEIDQRYIQGLQEKDKLVQQRIEKRARQQEENRKLTIQSAANTIEMLTTHKKEMQKRNAIFQSEMRGHVERFHREIAKVYAADENLRETKRVMDNFLRKFKPQIAAQLKNVLGNNSYSLEAKIFNVKNHAPIILNKNNELIRLEQNQKHLEQEIMKEELKQELINAKQIGGHSDKQVDQQQYDSNKISKDLLGETKKIAQPQPHQSKKSQNNHNQDIQTFEDDSDIDFEDNYNTQKNNNRNYNNNNQDDRIMANPNQTQKNPTQSQQQSYQPPANPKRNDQNNYNTAKVKLNNVLNEEVNDFDEFD